MIPLLLRNVNSHKWQYFCQSNFQAASGSYLWNCEGRRLNNKSLKSGFLYIRVETVKAWKWLEHGSVWGVLAGSSVDRMLPRSPCFWIDREVTGRGGAPDLWPTDDGALERVMVATQRGQQMHDSKDRGGKLSWECLQSREVDCGCFYFLCKYSFLSWYMLFQ